MRVQGETCISGNGEVVHREGVERLASFELRRGSTNRAQFCQAIRHEQNKDDESTIGRALDLEVAKEGVGTEQVESLVDNVGRVGIGSREISSQYLSERSHYA